MPMLPLGLNPYGLTYSLGLQGRGTARANPRGGGLEGFLAIARELGATVLEIYNPWLSALPDGDLQTLRARLEAWGATPVVSAGLHTGEPMEAVLRSARLLGATTIRLGLSPVLCGDRSILGARWDRMCEDIREALALWGPRADDEGMVLAIENHQDFDSEELVGLCELAGRGVGITFDMGNSFPVAEAPLDFTRRVAPLVRHLHVKDYRVQPTPEGFRLVRCAIGDGAVPHAEMIAMIEAHGRPFTAVLEPAALEARHVRLLTPEWWRGYEGRTASALAACLLAARVNALPEDADFRTPWERGEDAIVERYERDMIAHSAANMVQRGIMGVGGSR